MRRIQREYTKRICKDVNLQKKGKEGKELVIKKAVHHNPILKKPVYQVDNLYTDTDGVEKINNEVRGPFYDPHETHVHIWTWGTIPSIEDPKKPTFARKRKAHSGKYCKVCHCVQHKISLIKLEKPVDHFSVLSNFLNKYRLTKTCSIRKCVTHEPFFVNGTECIFLNRENKKRLKGTITFQEKVKKVRYLTIDREYKVPCTYASPLYTNLQKKKLVKYVCPPLRVPLRYRRHFVRGKCVRVKPYTWWTKLWKAYCSWKELQDLLGEIFRSQLYRMIYNNVRDIVCIENCVCKDNVLTQCFETQDSAFDLVSDFKNIELCTYSDRKYNDLNNERIIKREQGILEKDNLFIKKPRVDSYYKVLRSTEEVEREFRKISIV